MSDPRQLAPVVLAGALLITGVALKAGCLASDGLTLGELGSAWCYSDVAGLFQSRGLAADPLPYRAVMTEYPPLTGLQWWLAGLVGDGVLGFYLATAAVQVAAGVALYAVLAATAPRRVVWVLAAAPALVLTATMNWDLVAVLLLATGVVAWRREHDVAAGVLLGLGGLAKLFPLLAVPVLALSLPTTRRGGLRLAGAAAVTVLAVQVPVALWAPDGWDAWLTLNRARGVDWDTVWYGLQVLTGSPLAQGDANLLVAGAVVTGWAVVVWWWRTYDLPAVDVVLALTAWLLLAGKVWSPQFTLWLVPLLAWSRVPAGLTAAFLAADLAVVLTRFPFLSAQQGLDGLGYGPFAAALLLRGVLLVAVLAAAVRRPPAVRSLAT